jgi:glycosyltransferase involved in cell wall biosynthesis
LATTLCHINLARGFRGGERQTELLVRGLAARGWSQAAVVRRGEPLAVRLAGLEGLDVRPVGGNVLAAARALGRARLVHVHDGRSGQAAWLRRKASGTPYLLTRRVPNRPGDSFLTRRVYRDAACVVVLSEAIAAVMRSWSPELECVRIPSALAKLPFDPQRAAELKAGWQGRVVVGHLGALVDRHKGQRVLVDAARLLAPTHPDIHFVLLGEGPDEGRLRAAAAGLANVEFAGFRENVGDYLAAFDLFAYPSREEGLGSALLDALDFGLPVVASRVGGIPEVVGDGAAAVLVPPGDVEALAAAISALAADPGRRARAAAAARERARQFAPERMVSAYEALYARLLNEEPAREATG